VTDLNSLQELALGRAWVADNTHVEVSPQSGAFFGHFRDPPEHLEEDAAFDFIVALKQKQASNED